MDHYSEIATDSSKDGGIFCFRLTFLLITTRLTEQKYF